MFGRALIIAIASFLAYDFCRTEYNYDVYSALGIACCVAFLIMIVISTIDDIKNGREEKKWQSYRQKVIANSSEAELEEQNVIDKDDYNFLFEDKED